MQTGSFRDDWLFPFIIITVIYSISFGLTIYWLLPVQQMFAPEMAAFASLLFLPHGVRVLSAWLLGWKSIVLIAPVALFTHWLIFGAEGFSASGIHWRNVRRNMCCNELLAPGESGARLSDFQQ